MLTQTNENRRRWYGLRPGDTVNFMNSTVTVVDLHAFDNNGCTVRYVGGREGKAVCEWCKVLVRVEDSMPTSCVEVQDE